MPAPATPEVPATPGTPRLPDPWEFTFDWEDAAYCSIGADNAVADLPAGLLDAATARQISDLDDEAAQDRLTDLADTARQDERHDDENVLRDAAASLDYCRHGCSCASDAWDNDKDYLSQLLDELGDHTWSVVAGNYRGAGRTAMADATHLDPALMFAESNGSRGSWSHIEARWDGKQLTLEFSGRDVARTELSATPLLSEEHLQAYAVWTAAEPYEESLATFIRDSDPTQLAHAVRLWTDVDDPEHTFCTFGDLLNALGKVDPSRLTEDAFAVANTLAEGWRSSLADLFDAAIAILGDHRSFAAT